MVLSPQSLRQFQKSAEELPPTILQDHITRLLKLRQIKGPRECASATISMVKCAISHLESATRDELLASVRSVGKSLISAQSNELVIGNIVRRVLGLIREVSESESTDENVEAQDVSSSNTHYFPSMTRQGNSMDQAPQNAKEQTSIGQKLKDDVLDGLAEMLDEIDAADGQISEYSQEQINSDELIMTAGNSLTLQKFLLSAAKRGSSKGRRFTLIHVESFPNDKDPVYDTILHGSLRKDIQDGSQEVRLKSLAASGIRVIIISDSSVFALMPRVTKVVMAAQAVFSNGSCMSSTGSKTIAQAAKAYQIPVFILGAVYRLSPLHAFDANDYLQYGAPGKILPFTQSDLIDRLVTANPLSDIINFDLIDLIITNIGCHAPAFMHKLVKDHYHIEDYELS